MKHVESNLLNFKEACVYLNVKESFLRKLVLNKNVPFYKFGTLLRFDKRDLNVWIEKHKEGGNL